MEGHDPDEFELDDDWDNSHVRESQEEEESQIPSFRKDVTEKEKRQAKSFRDKMAEEMWTQYTKTLRGRT
jgi:hypothetical protein